MALAVELEAATCEIYHVGTIDTKELKTVPFDRPVTGRFFKFVALSSHNRHASLAELSLLEVSP